jgi:hypothetical protein
MAGFRITRFLGKMPRVSPEHLPETAAQVARNCKLYSGDLIPYPDAVATASTTRTGGIKTLYALRDPDTSDLVWLSWTGEVDIATPSIVEDTEQRIYYTGDGSPKVSNFDLATSGAGPYPSGYFRLGLPYPEDKVVATASAVPDATVSTIARTANQTTIVTSAPHGLTTDAFITVSGVQNQAGTYTQSTTVITCTITAHGLSVGDTVSLLFTTLATGQFPASGTYQVATVPTANTFTVTANNSDTDNGFARLVMNSFNVNNVVATVVNATTLTYQNFGFSLATKSVSGVKVTLSSTPITRNYIYTWVSDWNDAEGVGSDPSVEIIARDGQTVTITNIPMAPPAGNYNIRGVRLYRTVTGTITAEYLRLKTLWFPAAITSVQRASNVVTIRCAVRHKLSIDDRVKLLGITSDASFNGEGFVVSTIPDDYTFTFSQTASNAGPLSESAGKLYYDVSQREENTAVYMTGTTFTDNFDARLLFSSYQSDNYSPPPTGLEGIIAINDGMLAGFVGNLLYLTIPGEPHAWPEEYAITLEAPIVGLAAVLGNIVVLTESYPYLVSGSTPEVMSVSRLDTLYPCLSRRSIVNMNYGVVYATHEGLAVFSGSSGTQLITRTMFNSDTWNTEIDPSTIVATFYRDQYFASHSGGAFTFEFDSQTGGSFVDCDQIFTAPFFDTLTNSLYYVTGTDGVVYRWDDLTQDPQTLRWKSKVMISQDYINLGAARVVADYNSGSVVFRMYVNKVLFFTKTLTDDKPFRLPTGYRTDTYEFEVETDRRVRSIHVAETMIGLKQI